MTRFFLKFIGDIKKEITANMKLFVVDAKVKDLIEKEEDVEELQKNLDKLYQWEVNNKMKFNGEKFQLLRYGPNEDMKMDTLYFTGDKQFSSLRDLGVIMSDTARFDDHVDKVVKKVRQKV